MGRRQLEVQHDPRKCAASSFVPSGALVVESSDAERSCNRFRSVFSLLLEIMGTAGVNIFLIGYPNNPSLNILPPNNIFISSNPFNDFNHITVVSKTPADIRVVIEDLIS